VKLESLIEQSLQDVLASHETEDAPPRLGAAIRHAVFPGGARIRPKLCVAVAQACGVDDPGLTLGAAVAIELLHCASLVHDDLPCFDDSLTRRGVPTVHAAFGEQLAVLAGDGLIIMAFQALAGAGAKSRHRMPAVFKAVCDGVSTSRGITAGQAWECEPKVSLTQYQRAKTGALFAAACAAGALSAGVRDPAWKNFGDLLGEAYQVADDIRDVLADPKTLGKPVGKDEQLSRPSSARSLGLDGAITHFDQSFARVIAAVPDCIGADSLRTLARSEAERLVPKAWARDLLPANAARQQPPSKRSVQHVPPGAPKSQFQRS
jgi:geranylgeranyl diphosphate synthase, type II